MLNNVNVFTNLIDKLRLLFWDDRELRSSLNYIIGFYPHNISYYKQALMHKSLMHRSHGHSVNNERLEFLGDAILDAAVGDIVFRHFPGKHEGFLTNTRSKLVQRETLGRLAKEMGLNHLILSNGHTSSHNSYMAGNAFEALVGAIYLDRGYDACMVFLKKRILAKMINIDKMAYKEVNFKSKLIEWTQKNKVSISFDLLSAEKDANGSPTFSYRVMIEGVEGSSGSGFTKKESQQKACKGTLKRLRHEPQYVDQIFAAKEKRTRMEETPVAALPEVEEDENFIAGQSQEEQTAAVQGFYGDTPIPPSESAMPSEGTGENLPEQAEATREPLVAQPETCSEAESLVETTAELHLAVEAEQMGELSTESDEDTECDEDRIGRAEQMALNEEIIAAAEREAFEKYGGE